MQTDLDNFIEIAPIIGCDQLEILTLLRSNSSLNIYELADKLSWHPNTVNSYINELFLLKRVCKSDVRECFCERCNINRKLFKPMPHVNVIAWSIVR